MSTRLRQINYTNYIPGENIPLTNRRNEGPKNVFSFDILLAFSVGSKEKKAPRWPIDKRVNGSPWTILSEKKGPANSGSRGDSHGILSQAEEWVPGVLLTFFRTAGFTRINIINSRLDYKPKK